MDHGSTYVEALTTARSAIDCGIDPDTTDAQIHEVALSAVAAAQPARLVGVVEYLNSLREAKVMHLQWDEEGEKYILSSDPRQP